ncbi:MAG: tetratricopeptide repeat protein [Deltaproteobacteria bacterium]|nr:tetratricopeptide repeat protein [Deltaproteobacteria bacterium]
MALKEKILDRAQKFIQKGYLDKAIVEYKAAADVDPKDIAIRLRIGDLYVKTGRNAEAIKEYNDVARINAQRGFYLKAIAVYKQVLKLDDSSLEIHSKLAELYTKQRLIADAISEYSYIVSVIEKKGKTSDVVDLLKKMVEVDPENIGVRLKLADLYQKLSFDKDALAEYSFIFDKLLAQGKLDKAEKVYLGLYNSAPKEPVVLKGLSDLYKRKGDEFQFVKFSKHLFQFYKERGDTENAKAVCASILEVKPGDEEISGYMAQFRPSHYVEPPQTPVKTPEPEPEPIIEFPQLTIEEISQETVEIPEAPLISWPEEEIEITLEGFEALEQAPVEKGSFEEEVEFKLEEQAPVESVIEKHENILEEAKEVELEIPEVEAKEEEPFELEIEEEIEVKIAEEPKTEEVKIEEPHIEVEIEEPVQTEELKEIIEEERAAPEPLISIPELENIDKEAADVLKTEEPEQAQEEPLIEFPEIKEPQEAIEIEIEPEPAPAPEAMPEQSHEQAQIEAKEEEVPVSEEQITEQEIAEDIIPEAKEEEPAALAGIIEELVAETEEEPAEPLAEAPQEILTQAPLDEIEPEFIEQTVELKDEPAQEDIFEVQSGEQVKTSEPEPEITASEIIEEPVETAEDLSEAISELMEKMEDSEYDRLEIIFEDDQAEPEGEITAEAEPEPLKAQEIAPSEMIYEEKRADEIPSEKREDDYVDLSAELGMEEALDDLAGSWDSKEPKDTFDEFKKGIGNQLSKEDTETHYNLGIAYMEMELHAEAAKEFKIALKDPHLEFDCYIRLGLCAMSEHNPHEAIVYYLKGLKVEGKSEDERKGMIYELALAYEAAGEKEEAMQLFQSIYETDPRYREVSYKVKEFISSRPLIPLDDGMIEVEIL